MREKNIKYGGRKMRITANIVLETNEAKRQWSNIFIELKACLGGSVGKASALGSGHALRVLGSSLGAWLPAQPGVCLALSLSLSPTLSLSFSNK